MPTDRQYDVAIVGASIAGCTAAIFFARRGLSVALIERNPNLDAYKRLCTHVILSSAVPTIQRLGVANRIEQAGGIRNAAEFWTRFGRIRVPDVPENPRPYDYNLRRQRLDPLLRSAAIQSPDVDYLPGMCAESLLERNGRVTGIRLQTSRRAAHVVDAQLTVGADGKHSTVARLSELPCVFRPNDRFAVWAYFRELPLATKNISQVWLLEPDAAYMFPNDDHDPATARHLDSFGNRRISVSEFLSPRAIVRAASVAAMHGFRRKVARQTLTRKSAV